MTARTVTGRDPISAESLSVTIESGTIQAITAGRADETLWLSSGFIDMQVNGYGGFDLNAETIDPEIIISLTRKLLETGTTTFVPTIITASEQRIIAALRAIAKARRISPLAALAIPFVHMEGPHISPKNGALGAHSQEHVRRPDISEFERWQTASDNLVGIVTLSPHWDNSLEYISAVAAKGVLVAIGHTHASPAQIHSAAAAGATLSTHLGNGIAGFLPRHPNPIWAQLADDRLSATFIADGHHLPVDTLKAMLRAKGIERSILISDAVTLAGMHPGTYETTIGSRVELRSDGRLNMAGTDFLAGAACSLKDGIAHVAASGVCSLGDAIQMVTRNPGRLVGQRGLLHIGARADIVQFQWDTQKQELEMRMALLAGDEWR